MSLASNHEGATAPKLPLWDTICRSYSSYFHNFADVLRISWLWLAVAVPLWGIVTWLQLSWMAGVMADLKRGVPPQMVANLVTRPPGATALGYVAVPVLVLAGVSIAVAWHRCIILGEHPGLSGSNVATKNLWRYVGVGLAISLICIILPILLLLPMLFLLSPAVPGGAPHAIPIIFMLLILLLSLAGFAVMLRLSLLLPARAVGDLGLSFKQTWNRTRGNTWRIFWGMAACTLPPILLAEIAVFGVVGFPNFQGDTFVERMVAIGTIFNAYYLLILPIGIGFLSHAYWHFFKRT
jgi:hypothetical protein